MFRCKILNASSERGDFCVKRRKISLESKGFKYPECLKCKDYYDEKSDSKKYKNQDISDNAINIGEKIDELKSFNFEEAKKKGMVMAEVIRKKRKITEDAPLKVVETEIKKEVTEKDISNKISEDVMPKKDDMFIKTEEKSDLLKDTFENLNKELLDPKSNEIIVHKDPSKDVFIEKEKNVSQPKNDKNMVILDFSDYPYLYKMLQDMAKEDFRTLDAQIFYLIKSQSPHPGGWGLIREA